MTLIQNPLFVFLCLVLGSSIFLFISPASCFAHRMSWTFYFYTDDNLSQLLFLLLLLIKTVFIILNTHYIITQWLFFISYKLIIKPKSKVIFSSVLAWCRPIPLLSYHSLYLLLLCKNCGVISIFSHLWRSHFLKCDQVIKYLSHLLSFLSSHLWESYALITSHLYYCNLFPAFTCFFFFSFPQTMLLI